MINPLTKLIKEQREEFDKAVPGYSMNEYRESGTIVRPMMVVRGDAIKFNQANTTALLEEVIKMVEGSKKSIKRKSSPCACDYDEAKQDTIQSLQEAIKEL